MSRVKDASENAAGVSSEEMSRRNFIAASAAAVMGAATTDGRSLLAGDGHLQLSVPALFWQFAMVTRGSFMAPSRDWP